MSVIKIILGIGLVGNPRNKMVTSYGSAANTFCDKLPFKVVLHRRNVVYTVLQRRSAALVPSQLE